MLIIMVRVLLSSVRAASAQNINEQVDRKCLDRENRPTSGPSLIGLFVFLCAFIEGKWGIPFFRNLAPHPREGNLSFFGVNGGYS